MHKASRIKTRPIGRKRRDIGRGGGRRRRRRKEIGRQTKRADAPNGLVAHGEIRFATEQCIYTCCTRDTEVPTSLPAIHLHARSSHAARRRVIFTIIIKCMFLPLRAGRMPLHWAAPRRRMVYKDYKFYWKASPSSLFLPLFSLPPLFYLESSIRYWRTWASRKGRGENTARRHKLLVSWASVCFFSTDTDNTFTLIPLLRFSIRKSRSIREWVIGFVPRDEKHGITKIYLTWVVVEVGADSKCVAGVKNKVLK